MKDVGLGPTVYYARSKLANNLFTSITAVAVHPGVGRTDQPGQMKEAYGAALGTIMTSLTTPFMRTPEEGSLSTLRAATSDEIEKNR
ncbi:hypothetical protein NUW54_g4609 [Trametes sanguinea]|uniref:Uncharacterized protein n=1 Tax=Trametes sanguinea TaxID=158606 RepID=A0ACC1PXH3_9APHY|nr:hypothetical protein NUW54_g4609 [Trametes sanguinea]